MNFYMLVDYISFLFQIVLNEMLCRGTSPQNLANITATLLNMLLQSAQAAAMA